MFHIHHITRGFIPWLVYYIFSGFRTINYKVVIIASFMSCLIFCFNELKQKYILAWGSIIYFSLSIILIFFSSTIPIEYLSFISNVAFALIMWISIIFRRPFTLQYSKENIAMHEPRYVHFLKVHNHISILWALTISLMAVDIYLEIFHMIGSTISDIIIIILFLVAIKFTFFYPKFYKKNLK